jgi:hypothetical protein
VLSSEGQGLGLVGGGFGFVDPGGVGQLQGFRLRSAGESFGVLGPGGVQDLLPGDAHGVGVAVVDRGWGVQADAGVVVFVVVPGEKRVAECAGVLDRPEAAREARVVFDCFERGSGVSVF